MVSSILAPLARRRATLGVALLATALVSACGKNTTDSSANVVGGEVVTARVAKGPEFTSTVAITYDGALSQGQSYCSGTLIDAKEKLVLTAAHCFQEAASGRHWVSFGTKVGGAGGVLRRAKAVVVHPDYDHALTIQAGRFSSPSHDVALLKFEGTVPEGFAATPLALAGETLPRDLTLAGFGTTGTLRLDAKTGTPIVDRFGRPLTESDSGLLRRVEVGLVRAFSSGRVFDVRGKTARPQGACPGDSGGPAYAITGGRWKVFGVLSTGLVGAVDVDGDGRLDVGCVGANTYTDVRAYREFLRKAAEVLRVR
jgi:hypothetical protein